jgi:hypothetical protein
MHFSNCEWHLPSLSHVHIPMCKLWRTHTRASTHVYGRSIIATPPISSDCCTFLPKLKCISRSPGDYLKPGEDEIDGLKRRLDERLAPPTSNQFDQVTHGINNDWEIGDCLAQWWRPNFETFMVS